jgi:DNA repair photolyase
MSKLSTVVALKPRSERTPRARGSAAGLPFAPEHVFVDRCVADAPMSLRILGALKGTVVDIVDDVRALKRPRDLAAAKRQLILTAHRGEAFKACQGITAGAACCGLRVLDLVSGCPMACSYCILQSYLANNPMTTVYVNIEAILAEVSAFLARHPDSFFRICTGELSDSLAFDPIIDAARVLIAFFAAKRNALLELKTKTAFVDHLLDLPHNGRTVFSWSVNTPAIIESEERETATLTERLEAARKVSAAGYGVGFHFDPIIMRDSAEATAAAYEEVIEAILAAVPARSIAWVSLGLLRFPLDLPELAERSFPGTRIFTGELVPIEGKVRYPRFLREEVYRPLWKRLTATLPPHKIYLCMETPAMWRRIDPSVESGRDIERRLCHTETLCTRPSIQD